MDNYLVEKIAKFYRVCLFGSSESDVYKAAANRAYRDLCRTIKFKDKDDKNKNDKCRCSVNELIIEKIKYLPDANQEAYDEFHLGLCGQIIEEYRKSGVAELTYGQAQKWVNMTMKYLCVLTEGNFTGKYEWLGRFYPYLHVPIDSIILNKIAEARFPNFNLDKNLSWSKIDKYEFYLEIQKNLRKSLTAMSPMDWEFEVWG